MNVLLRRLSIALCLVLPTAGCIKHKASYTSTAPTPMADHVIVGYGSDGTPLHVGGFPGDDVGGENGMRIWTASLTIETDDLGDAVARAVAVAQKHGGYLESRTDSTHSGASLKLRIPALTFTNALGSLESLGEVVSRRVGNEDVTEAYIDVDARLKNKLVLRDRLRGLLDQASDIKDILAIETELNRVQGDIDSMEARLKTLRGQIDFATLDLNLRPIVHKPKKILGPLGYLFKGLFWTVEKLFVIRG